MLTSLRKSSSVSSFSIACFRFTQCTEFLFLFTFPPVCSKGFAYLLCWPRGRGIGLLCTRRFSSHEFYNFSLFNFLIFYLFRRLIFTHDIYPHPHPRPTTFTHYPRPTTFSYTRVLANRRSEVWFSHVKKVIRPFRIVNDVMFFHM